MRRPRCHFDTNRMALGEYPIIKKEWFFIMYRIKKAAVIGGDLRSIAAAGRLRERGCETRLYGFRSCERTSGEVDSLCCSSRAADDGLTAYLSKLGEPPAPNLASALDGCDTAILPLPATSDRVHLSMPFSDESLTLDELIYTMKRQGIRLVCGGRLDADFAARCEAEGMTCFDYFAREEFAVANAVPTAEGAIAIALDELAVTLSGSEVLVVGFGRIGKLLAMKLAALGARVTVSARRADDFAWIRALGYDCADTTRLCDYFSAHAPVVIYNTVPSHILGRSELELIPEDTLIVDLASNPGGVDIQTAGALGRRVIWALSLPGKSAPLTAGRIVADTICDWAESQMSEGGDAKC